MNQDNKEQWSNLKDILIKFKTVLEYSTAALNSVAEKEKEKVEKIKETLEYKNGKR